MLFIVDPQVDKQDNGAMPVPGADADSKRLADLIIRNMSKIDDIVITMESRHVSQAWRAL